jgi:hypothetical protein
MRMRAEYLMHRSINQGTKGSLVNVTKVKAI